MWFVGNKVHEIPKQVRTGPSLSLLPRRRLRENKYVLYHAASQGVRLEQDSPKVAYGRRDRASITGQPMVSCYSRKLGIHSLALAAHYSLEGMG